MDRWRFGRSWSDAEMKRFLAALKHRPVNFDNPPEEMIPANGWTVDGTDEEIASEPEGPPLSDGPFHRAKQAILNYDFSDPTIVVGHFDPTIPPSGRDMLLELKVWGFRFLTGVRVHSVREDQEHGVTYFGFRYDTLEGNIERGYEWFLLTKDHETGGIHFKIEAHWQPGDFPNWWSRIGFKLIGEHYRTLWRYRAPARMRKLAHQAVATPIAAPGGLVHRGDESAQRTEPAREH